MLATTMYTLDGTIANVALPHMQGGLSAGIDQITWVLTSFIVAQAIGTPLVGWFAGRFGRKRVMLTAIAAFTLSSLACGTAISIEQMILYRIVQGLSGAAFVPLAQAILFDINPPEKFAEAMSIFGAGVVLAPILGPALGGWITESLNWRWVFLINLPVGILAFLGVMTFLPEKTAADKQPFDFSGFASLALFIVSLQMIFDRGPGKEWFASNEIRLYGLLCASGLYFFTWRTLVAQRPFFARSLFADANFMLGCAVGLLTGVLMFSSLALLPPMMQNLMGYPIVTAGLVTMPRGIGMVLSMVVAGRLASRIDPRYLLASGFLINALSLWQMSLFTLDMGSMPITISGLIQGFGLGLVFIPSNTLAFASISSEQRTDASAVFTLVRSTGSAIGISGMQALFVSNSQSTYGRLIENVRPDNPNLPGLPGGGMETLAPWISETARQSAMISYVNDFRVAMFLTLALLPLVVFMRRPTAPPPRNEIHAVD
ncbi:MAG: DHA2 family efflux MFS transporter permease subunit [Alphaproteobacteria bacterium]|nr:DHA2 family efflux MFS transporter permease subunit [Alphaproteobacteria bacterium]